MANKRKIKELTSAYINYYVAGSDEPCGIRVITLNGKDSKIFYKTDYNTYIPNAINYIIGLLAHFGNIHSKPEQHVFISNKLLAKNIGVSYSHASIVMDQIIDIFKIDVQMGRGRGRSRKVRLTEPLIDFMKVFSEEQLHEYMFTHKTAASNRFALTQVYRYMGWGISPGQLTTAEKENREDYMHDQHRKNFLHYAYTSKHKIQTRLDYLDKHQDKLTDLQKRQLESIKAEHVPGMKLIHYWFNVLIQIQQTVSYIIEKAKKKTKDTSEQTTSNNNENQNKGESVAHSSATKVAQRKSEDPDASVFQFMGKVITSWNERAVRNNLPAVKRITKERYNSLLEIREEYSEKEIFEALAKIEVIHQGEYEYKFTFERFIQSETILFALEYDSNSSVAVKTEFMTDMFTNMSVNKRISLVPEFNSVKELNTWVREQN